MSNKFKKIIILGSGALKIGEAGEFDYSGSQAIKALKEEGIKTILVNPNIATIQTSEFLADEVYFVPVTDYFVEKVIQKEKPDGIFLSFGGQTALNCGMSLYKKKILQKYNVEVLGTPVDSIILTEDREKFANHLRKIGIHTPMSKATESVDEAIKIARGIGYPIMIRAGFTLGGQKSGVVWNEKELVKKAIDALAFSPQILVERYLHHFKEIEYEVVRDIYDNCVTVCNMENMDPLGIHTGESIVVAPSQTLTNFEYHYLRQKSIEIVRSLGIVGECNVQYALNPNPKINSKLETLNSNFSIDYYVIEVNARLSRSSALASKATGYPLAYVAAKLALKKGLTEIKNQVTQVTQSCFEPALDYLVVKIPRWDLEKFKGVEEKIGSSMKSVGEVMAIGRSFEEAIQKAVRMLDIGAQGVTENNFPKEKEAFLKYIKIPTPKRLFAIAEGLKREMSVGEVYKLTGIDPWFLYRIKNIVDTEQKLRKLCHAELVSASPPASQARALRAGHELSKGSRTKFGMTRERMLELKQLGFSDRKIGEIVGKTELEVRDLRKKYKVTPSIFQIDTLAGEFPAKTNYLYTTYHGSHHDVVPLGKKAVMVLGSGPYRIGSSVEFDWTCVNTALALKKHKKKSIIINCNPETVSTDYDISDRLYFEELTFERIVDIYDFETSYGVVVSVGGQTPNNVAQKIAHYGIPLLGTKAEDIDQAEDRNKFSTLLDRLNVSQPPWNTFTTIEKAIDFASNVGYPVLIRPSYVLSGSAMNVCFQEEELRRFIKKATDIGREHPVIVSKFIPEAKEIEFDGVAEEGEVQVYAISEHIENAGVHSGDASVVYPPQKMYLQTERRVKEIGHVIAKALHITGPFNIQFVAKENSVQVIEVNLRASRTFPFISKVTGVNFAEKIVDAFFGKSKKVTLEYPRHALVKVAQFSFARLEGADPILRVEMASTGEVACFGETEEEAYLKALYSTGIKLETKSALLSLGGMLNKERFIDSARTLIEMGYTLYATKKTSEFLIAHGVENKPVHKVDEKKSPTVLDLINSKQVAVVINLREAYDEKGIHHPEAVTAGYLIRRAAVDKNIPLFTDLNAARLFVKALSMYSLDDLQIKSWKEYKSSL